VTPSISVIIPVYNSAETLRKCLDHLRQSLCPSLETIAVDDGSTDGSAQVAKEFGATLLCTAGRHGPAAARNIGARAAKGEILFFLDADVCPCPDTLLRVQSSFGEDPELDALIGSYDDAPASPDFISQYKNLMHCFVHQGGRRVASTFWSGCGAIRRQVFSDHNGFDEGYRRPAIEDIELGYRLVHNHRKVILDRDLQVKHLKRWTFWGLLKSDVLDRGIPWTELILRDRHMPSDLNLQLSQRISVALVYLLLGIGAACAIFWRGYFLTPLFAVLFFLLGRYWLDGSRSRTPSAVVITTLAAGAIVYLAWRHYMPGLIPPVVLGYVLIFAPHRYAWSGEKRPRWAGLAYGSYFLLSILFFLTYMPRGLLIAGLALTLLLIVILNNRFYLFLAARRGHFFALAAIPFHLLYHFFNGLSFTVGLLRWAGKSAFSRKPEVLVNSVQVIEAANKPPSAG
jgi:glycosyltransferase involved in cell wall biosynthesis